MFLCKRKIQVNRVSAASSLYIFSCLATHRLLQNEWSNFLWASYIKTLTTPATYTMPEGVNHSFPFCWAYLLSACTIFCAVHLMPTVISITETYRFSCIESLNLKDSVNLQIRGNVLRLRMEGHSQKLYWRQMISDKYRVSSKPLAEYLPETERL